MATCRAAMDARRRDSGEETLVVVVGEYVGYLCNLYAAYITLKRSHGVICVVNSP